MSTHIYNKKIIVKTLFWYEIIYNHSLNSDTQESKTYTIEDNTQRSTLITVHFLALYIYASVI